MIKALIHFIRAVISPHCLIIKELEKDFQVHIHRYEYRKSIDKYPRISLMCFTEDEIKVDRTFYGKDFHMSWIRFELVRLCHEKW